MLAIFFLFFPQRLLPLEERKSKIYQKLKSFSPRSFGVFFVCFFGVFFLSLFFQKWHALSSSPARVISLLLEPFHFKIPKLFEVPGLQLQNWLSAFCTDQRRSKMSAVVRSEGASLVRDFPWGTLGRKHQCARSCGKVEVEMEMGAETPAACIGISSLKTLGSNFSVQDILMWARGFLLSPPRLLYLQG